jgi:hypothetical protein
MHSFDVNNDRVINGVRLTPQHLTSLSSVDCIA